MVLLAVWAVINVTTPIRAFAAHHLLHFFSLYWPYLPPVEVIIAVPVVIVGEYLLYGEFGPMETAILFWWCDTHFFHNLLRKGEMEGCYTL